MRNQHLTSFLIGILSLFCLNGYTQKGSKQITTEIKEERAQENYSYLKDSTRLLGLAAVKYIPLAQTSFLSIGGSFRPRFEHFTNRFWTTKDENYYCQRLSFHTDIRLNSYIRLFAELYHGYKTGEEATPQSDKVDFHQSFVEAKVPMTDGDFVSFRLGRQEMKLGSGRLVDIRVGPNIRRSFDMGQVCLKKERWNIRAFYGKEVTINFDAFDNSFELFNEDATNPRLWGVYGQFTIFQLDGVEDSNELYYMGFQSDLSNYSDVVGSETRHSIGIRRYGRIKSRLQYNTEFIYQFGEIGITKIRAFNLETDWKFTISKKKWKPTIGLKFDWSSGDRSIGDDRLNSFNPMFVNPAIYSLAGVNTPINLLRK